MIERQNDALAKETMEWDDIIHEEQAKRTELPEGDYSFTVKRLEKGRFEGSDKLPACNIATLTLEVPTEEGSVEIRTRLYLIRKLEYRTRNPASLIPSSDPSVRGSTESFLRWTGPRSRARREGLT